MISSTYYYYPVLCGDEDIQSTSRHDGTLILRLINVVQARMIDVVSTIYIVKLFKTNSSQ